MAATFDPALSTDKDWVRVLIGDTVAPFTIQDETIEAILVEAIATGASALGAKYCAAAQAGEVALSRWTALGGATIEKQVSKLKISYIGSSDSGATDAWREYLKGLKQKCTQLSLSSPAVLKSW